MGHSNWTICSPWNQYCFEKFFSFSLSYTIPLLQMGDSSNWDERGYPLKRKITSWRSSLYLNHVVHVDGACARVEGAVLSEDGSEGDRGHQEEGETRHLFNHTKRWSQDLYSFKVAWYYPSATGWTSRNLWIEIFSFFIWHKSGKEWLPDCVNSLPAPRNLWTNPQQSLAKWRMKKTLQSQKSVLISWNVTFLWHLARGNATANAR